jgi:hypothetical protein
MIAIVADELRNKSRSRGHEEARRIVGVGEGNEWS